MLKELVNDLTNDQLDEIIDNLGIYTTDEAEDESRQDKILMIQGETNKEIIEAISKIENDKKTIKQ
ncbi:hypothetical protein HY497_02415 [Candidatus Woesearchaeota archaeon]|nr:hypothetical protein [Candidatus Woesearchaeota archaeon]